MAGFMTLDRNNALIKQVYETRQGNIFIRENHTDNNYCYVYCSSNNLYKKDNESDFFQKIVQENRFEWMNRSAKNSPAKEIFIRDVWLSWYANGVNQKINSIERLIEFIRIESSGMDLVTIGVSSGGFIAAILASECNAVRCFDFSGQFSIQNHFNHSTDNPFISQFYDGKKQSGGGYFEAYKFIQKSKTSIYYFYPYKCKQDSEQAVIARSCDNVKCIAFDSNRHGSPVLSVSLPVLLSYSNDMLDQMYGKNRKRVINPVLFSCKVSGIIPTARFLFYKTYKILKKRALRHKE